MSGIKYTQQEDDYIRRHIGVETYEQIAEGMNKLFGNNRTGQSVNDRASRRLKLSNMAMSVKSRYNRDNYRPRWMLPIGTERKTQEYTYVKIDNQPSQTTSYCLPNWIKKHVMVWERANGKKVPEGWNVVFLNGDRQDFSPENLYAISKRTNARLATRRWWTHSVENNLAAIKYCELEQEITKHRHESK